MAKKVFAISPRRFNEISEGFEGFRWRGQKLGKQLVDFYRSFFAVGDWVNAKDAERRELMKEILPLLERAKITEEEFCEWVRLYCMMECDEPDLIREPD